MFFLGVAPIARILFIIFCGYLVTLAVKDARKIGPVVACIILALIFNDISIILVDIYSFFELELYSFLKVLDYINIMSTVMLFFVFTLNKIIADFKKWDYQIFHINSLKTNAEIENMLIKDYCLDEKLSAKITKDISNKIHDL